MLNLDQHMDIKLLHRQGHSIRAIARMAGHSRNTVRKVLTAKTPPVFQTPKRSSKLDPFKGYLKKRVDECNLSGVRLLDEIRAMGYQGGHTVLKTYLRTLRPRTHGKLTVRFETPPGEQAQCDWGYCGRYRDASGQLHSIYAFVWVLGFSRFMYVCFTTRMHLKTLVRCHQQAFDYCGGWTRSILYDNMKQVRLDAKTWNPHFMDFADHYGLVAKTHRPYRPRTKGKVERMVRYVKDNFLNGRGFADLEDLNAQALVWLDQTANRRVHQTTRQRPCDLLPREKLTGCGTIAPYQWVEREPRVVTSEAMVLYQKSHYSVPAIAAGQPVVVEAGGHRVSIRMGDAIIAEHPRAERPGQRIEQKSHVRERWESVLEATAKAPPPAPRWTIGNAHQAQTRDLNLYQEMAQ
jgi:transposase